MQVFVIINNVGMMNAGLNAKNWLIKVYLTKNLFRILVIVSVNVMNHDVGEYLDYEKCKCKKKLVDKLVECSYPEEYTENTDEVKIVEMVLFEHGNECVCSYTICVVLVVIAISIGIGTYFVYCKYMNHNKENVSKRDYVYQATNY